MPAGALPRVTVGVGNIMLIGVLERRSEIGLRRALGATKANIRGQFLAEAILLALLGGAVASPPARSQPRCTAPSPACSRWSGPPAYPNEAPRTA
jgi:FtsX-like permease family